MNSLILLFDRSEKETRGSETKSAGIARQVEYLREGEIYHGSRLKASKESDSKVRGTKSGRATTG